MVICATQNKTHLILKYTDSVRHYKRCTESDVYRRQNMTAICSPIKSNMSNFHQLEIVGRGSETQLLVGEKLNYLI